MFAGEFHDLRLLSSHRFMQYTKNLASEKVLAHEEVLRAENLLNSDIVSSLVHKSQKQIREFNFIVLISQF